jgi:Bardet-Biedl syndrome 2 protein
LGYDVERNADAFFVDVQDGVHSLVVGKVGNSPKPLVIAGGNCSVLGFDERGTESFWTVTGDNVSAMALCDLNSSGKPLLLVGSDDFEIRVFQQEELLNEITEADKVTILTPIGNGSKFAYGLANGTVGVYTGVNSRLWRVKTKNKVTAIESYDLDMDGVPEVFSGWDNGMFAVRREENGEVVFRQTLEAPVAAILKADYRMDGKEEVMICSEAGEIRAYLASDVDLSTVAGNGLTGKDNAADQKALAELQAQKLELLAEMKLLERSLKMNSTKEVPVGMLPHGTTLTYTLEGDLKLGAVALKVEVNTDCQIMNLIAVDLGTSRFSSAYYYVKSAVLC